MLGLEINIIFSSDGPIPRRIQQRKDIGIHWRPIEVRNRVPMMGPVHNCSVERTRKPTVGEYMKKVPNVDYQDTGDRRHGCPTDLVSKELKARARLSLMENGEEGSVGVRRYAHGSVGVRARWVRVELKCVVCLGSCQGSVLAKAKAGGRLESLTSPSSKAVTAPLASSFPHCTPPPLHYIHDLIYEQCK
ncbi:hypothetical protein Scep_008541 [Stephania cephalantha]|uniref:Uncharacterized protein n=1 Tax=Stephania cephalantha TaxID=152367 RepID=A0AAP0PP81_9MAGN